MAVTRPRLASTPKGVSDIGEPKIESFPQFDLPVTMPPAAKPAGTRPNSVPPASSLFPPPRSAAVLDALPPVNRVYRPDDVIAGKYQLNRVLGQGGMGEVWIARNRDLDADVAIKLIRSESNSDDSADRLLREAQAAAKLSGPAIVRVFDFGKTQYGDPYIVMELLEGEDLSHALRRRGRLSPIKAVRIMLPICQALANAHGVGIVHRDLKPENIFLAKTPGGQVQPKLLDFGVAKVGRAFSTRLTQTGAMLGSPLYMSPEHARGDEVDYRADIWAFCVVLYEVITGRAPFDGKNYNAVLYSIIASEPPATTTLGAGDDELWAAIGRGMRKDPDERWPSMDELGRALARWLVGHDTLDDITGVSLQATWLDSPARPSTDPLETLRPPALMDELTGKVKLGMPGAPSFQKSPALQKRLFRRNIVTRHPLLLSALIGLLGALLVVLVLKATGNADRTVTPAVQRVRQLAQRARAFAHRSTAADPAASNEVQAAGVPASPSDPSAANLTGADPLGVNPAGANPAGADRVAAPASGTAKPLITSSPTGHSKRSKPPPVNKLKNPFRQ
ncbi:MAG TPA: serine/threonine-protein kinase [Polyangiaceae bacterium]|nr:serine/threonine-protein kinase [Polyangiaceae bacterium]